jgi:hypothetical protein
MEINRLGFGDKILTLKNGEICGENRMEIGLQIMFSFLQSFSGD